MGLGLGLGLGWGLEWRVARSVFPRTGCRGDCGASPGLPLRGGTVNNDATPDQGDTDDRDRRGRRGYCGSGQEETSGDLAGGLDAELVGRLVR